MATEVNNSTAIFNGKPVKILMKQGNYCTIELENGQKMHINIKYLKGSVFDVSNNIKEEEGNSLSKYFTERREDNHTRSDRKYEEIMRLENESSKTKGLLKESQNEALEFLASRGVSNANQLTSRDKSMWKKMREAIYGYRTSLTALGNRIFSCCMDRVYLAFEDMHLANNESLYENLG
ncbi:MAG: hypothetical protein MJ237_04465 [bacterium]|nr:hypothetical protein [bacterium]